MSHYSKAIAAFITPLVLSWLLPLGITATSTTEEIVSTLVLALGTALTVYFVRNK